MPKSKPTHSSANRYDVESLEPRILLSATTVTNVAELTAALANSSVTTINVAAGTYELSGSVAPQAGQTIVGAGQGQTIITADSSWNPGTANFQDRGDEVGDIVRTAYLFNFADNTFDVEISDLTLTAPNLHGALFAWNPDRLNINNVEFDDFLWSGIRVFGLGDGDISNNTFVDAAGQLINNNGRLINGGAAYLTFTDDTVFSHNTITRTAGEGTHFGFKGRRADNVQILNNTIKTGDFSVEIPFGNDVGNEIAYNYLEGISLKQNGGGIDPVGGDAYHIHHNVIVDAKSIEFLHNGLQIDHNLFDFDANDDGNNLAFGSLADTASGATDFHNNRIKNPSLGLVDIGNYDNFTFRNNHIYTADPHDEFGYQASNLFNFGNATDFSTIVVKDNIFELNEGVRDLFHPSDNKSAVVVENNDFVNGSITDAASYTNTQTSATQGVTSSFDFTVGVDNAFQVKDWAVYEVVGGTDTFLIEDPDITLKGSTRIQAEDFDYGASYSDTTAGNNGGVYRPGEDVDIQATSDTGGGFNVGWTAAGEYLEYTIDTEAGEYDVSLRVASNLAGRQVRVLLDGTELGVVTSNQAGWQNFSTKTISAVTLGDGEERTLRLEFVNGSVNVNWIEFTPVQTSVTIEAEDFTTKGGNIINAAKDLRVETTYNNFATQNVGRITEDTHLGFQSVDFGTGSYSEVEVRWSARMTEGVLELRTGDPVTGTLLGSTTLTDTGSWDTYQEKTLALSSPLTGVQDVYMVFTSTAGSDYFLFNLDSFVFT